MDDGEICGRNSSDEGTQKEGHARGSPLPRSAIMKAKNTPEGISKTLFFCCEAQQASESHGKALSAFGIAHRIISYNNSTVGNCVSPIMARKDEA
jgi:hypothetical protein